MLTLKISVNSTDGGKVTGPSLAAVEPSDDLHPNEIADLWSETRNGGLERTFKELLQRLCEQRGFSAAELLSGGGIKSADDLRPRPGKGGEFAGSGLKSSDF